jgi:HAD superfamily hydrolase (TIGR01509 family)
MLPTAILFDFDGILVDTEWAIYQAWRKTFLKQGHDLPLSLYTKCIGSNFDTWSPKTYLEELTHQTFDWERMDEERQVEILSELSLEGAMTGVMAVLEKNAQHGIIQAVVSSSSHSWVGGWLDKLDMRKFFSRVVCRGDAPRIKPAPDLYLHAARELGLVPTQCLVIEDSKNGLIAADAAGMRTWIVPNRVTAGLDFSLAEKVFPDFAALSHKLHGH